MIIHGSPGGGWRLDEAADFQGCKVVLPGLDPGAAPPIDGLAFEAGPGGATHAWVQPDLPARLAGPLADESWRAGFAAMLAFAQKRGWVREDGAVRAHVERA